MKEIRLIVFEEAELMRALSDFRRKQGEPLPPGLFKCVEIKSQSPFAVILFIEDDRGFNTFSNFNEAEIAAAMVAFCIVKCVPLPVKAKKSLTMFGKNMALRILLGMDK